MIQASDQRAKRTESSVGNEATEKARFRWRVSML